VRSSGPVGLDAGSRCAARDGIAEICAGYTETELELLAGFLRRTADAGRSATNELASNQTEPGAPPVG
jgi:hypothetical protein